METKQVTMIIDGIKDLRDCERKRWFIDLEREARPGSNDFLSWTSKVFFKSNKMHITFYYEV